MPSFLTQKHRHWVKCVQIRCFFWSVFSRIWTEYCGKIRTRKISVFGHFSRIERLSWNKVKKQSSQILRSNSSVIWQKVESQNGGNKNTKHAKFSEKRTFFTPWYAHVRVRIRWCYLRFEIRPVAILPTNFSFEIY